MQYADIVNLMCDKRNDNCYSSSTSIAWSNGSKSRYYSTATSRGRLWVSNHYSGVQCFKGTMLTSLVVEENRAHRHIHTNSQYPFFLAFCCVLFCPSHLDRLLQSL